MKVHIKVEAFRCYKLVNVRWMLVWYTWGIQFFSSTSSINNHTVVNKINRISSAITCMYMYAKADLIALIKPRLLPLKSPGLLLSKVWVKQ